MVVRQVGGMEFVRIHTKAMARPMTSEISGTPPDGGPSDPRKKGDKEKSGTGVRKESFTIGELSREFDVTLRALRFYEDKGLLNPRRRGQTRIYSRRDRARLRLLLMGKRVGFSLSEIRDLLDLYDLKDGHVTQLRVALEKFQEQVHILEAQKADIETAIKDLNRTCEVISGMLREREKK
jgi:DNA-binding transcriptional MerR regulator